MRKSKWKIGIIGLIVIVVIVIIMAKGGKDKENEKVSGPEYVTVKRGDIVLIVNATGRIISNREVEIKSKASGEIKRLPFEVSDPVRNGDLLVELDPVDEQRNVDQRLANLAVTQARVAQARRNLKIAETTLTTGRTSAEAALDAAKTRLSDCTVRLERTRGLFNKKVVSQEELDAIETETDVSRSQLRQAEARIVELKKFEDQIELVKQDVVLAEAQERIAQIEVENAQRRFQETKIYSPIDGVLSTQNVQIGQIVASGISNVGGGTTLMTVADLSRIFVNATVDESDIGSVAIGQPVIITTDAYPGKRFKGKVIQIATRGVNRSNVITFDVKIEIIDEISALLKPEMTANVEIKGERREQVLLVPNSAVGFDGDIYFVYRMTSESEDESERVPVEVGLSDGLDTEIMSGLEEKDKVRESATSKSKWENLSEKKK